MEEYGGPQEEQIEEEAIPGEVKPSKDVDVPEGKKDGKGRTALMSEEERERGAVPAIVYAKYLKQAGNLLWGPWLLITLCLMQGASSS